MGSEHENRCCMQEVNRWVAFRMDSVHMVSQSQAFLDIQSVKILCSNPTMKGVQLSQLTYEHPSHISHDTWRGKNPVTGADTYLSAGCDIADAGSYTSRWFCWANCSFFVLRFSVPQARCRCCTCTGAPVCGRRRFSVPSIGISSTSAQHQTTAVLIKGNHHSWHVVFTFLCCPPVQTLYQSARFLARKRCLALILLILLRKRVTGETDLASHHIPPFFSGISKSMDSILRWTILKGL